jgi:peptidoglycan/xylan/chitin deacetylase (PgdA/CDA1 family)
MKTIFCLKVDVDTERGTKIGVPNLVSLFKELEIPATFLFSLGPDNTGKAITRIFRPGFLKKVSRTSVISTHGIRTLLNGVLLPAPHIGKRHAELLKQVKEEGFEVGIHCYDHYRWQDHVGKMSLEEVFCEFAKALAEFQRIFGVPSRAAGAPGWQANEKTLTVYDAANLLYGSDCRGETPFFPKVGNKIFNTLQIPTTLPTLDELVGLPDYPLAKISDNYASLLKNNIPNVMTIHAELEGMKYLNWFKDFLLLLKKRDIEFRTLESVAQKYLAEREKIHICEMIQGEVPNRSGALAIESQGVVLL